jgi:hypothetical protein
MRPMNVPFVNRMSLAMSWRQLYISHIPFADRGHESRPLNIVQRPGAVTTSRPGEGSSLPDTCVESCLDRKSHESRLQWVRSAR